MFRVYLRVSLARTQGSRVCMTGLPAFRLPDQVTDFSSLNRLRVKQ